MASGQDTTDLKVAGYSGSITDAAGNLLDSTGVTKDTGIQIDTTAPTVTLLSDVTSNGSDLNAGQTVTFALAANEALTIADFIDWCKEGLAKAKITGEILIVDSSTDDTATIALARLER